MAAAAVAYFNRRLGFTQLVSVGVHVGHSLLNSSIYAAWLVYGYRAGICLINLHRFGRMLRLGFQVMDFIVSLGRPLWFVNQDKAFARYVSYYALQCGEFSSAALWIRGMLSNFKVVGAFAQHHAHYSAFANNRKQQLLDKAFTQWFLTRYTWPGMVFVSSISANYAVVNEAMHSGVPCIGIADSDAMVQACTIAVPGNDDALDSVVFYHDLIAEYILYRKFSKVYLWFLHVRRAKRLLSFYDWLALKKKNKGSLDFGFFFSSHLSQRYGFGKLAINFLLGQGSWSRVVVEQLQVFRDASLFPAREALDRLEQGAAKHHYLFHYFFFSRVWRRRGRLLFSRKVRRRRRLRHRRSMALWLRKNMKWKTLRFVRKLRYLRRLYGLRRGRIGVRRHLWRFLHYYMLLYFFYLKAFKRIKASFRVKRRKLFRIVSRRRLRSEFHSYWRYYRKYFRNRKHYEATLRLGTQRQRTKLWRGRFAIFQLLFQVFHEPWLEQRLKLQREWHQRHSPWNRWQKKKEVLRPYTKPHKGKGHHPKQQRRYYAKNNPRHNKFQNNPRHNKFQNNKRHNKFQNNKRHNKFQNNKRHNKFQNNKRHNKFQNNKRHNKFQNNKRGRRRQSWVHLSFGRWRGFYKKAIKLFYTSPAEREKHFLGIVYPNDPDYRARYQRRRAANILLGHKRVEASGRKLFRRVKALFRLGRFLGSLRREMLRMVFFGFFFPKVGSSGVSFFAVTGALARLVEFRRRKRFSRPRRRRPNPKAPLRRFYGAALQSLSLGFWGRRRHFFIGHITFGYNSQGFRHQRAAYDFSLATYPGGPLWRTPLDGQRWLARSPSQGKALHLGKANISVAQRLRSYLRRWRRARKARKRRSWEQRRKRALLAASRGGRRLSQSFPKNVSQGFQKEFRKKGRFFSIK